MNPKKFSLIRKIPYKQKKIFSGENQKKLHRGKTFLKCTWNQDDNSPRLWNMNLSTEKNYTSSFKLIKKNFQESFFRFPFNNFKYYFTLLSKFFSSFLHSTFSLSVFCQYLAFGELHHQFWAAFPNNSTLRRKIFLQKFLQNFSQGYHLLWRCFPTDFNFGA